MRRAINGLIKGYGGANRNDVSAKIFMSIFKKDTLVVFLIFILALGLRLYILASSDNYHGIALGKAQYAVEILKDPGIRSNFDPAHAPFPHYIFAAALYLWNDPFLAPRIVSLIFGSLLIFPFYYYVKMSFDQRTALYASLMTCFYSQHVIYSVLSTGETMFHFFLFSSFVFFLKFNKKRRKVSYLILSAFLLGSATMCRFEGGVFIPLLTLFLLSKRKKYAVVFFLIAMILPVWWMFINHWVVHDPFLFLRNNDTTVATFFNMARLFSGLKLDLFDRIVGWPKILWEHLTPYTAILGFAGVVYSFVRKKNIFPSFLFLTLFLIFVYKTAAEELLLDGRYGITLALLLIPFSVFMLQRAVRKITKGRTWVPLIIFVVFFSSRMMPMAIDQKPMTPFFVKDIGSYLARYLTEEDSILVDTTEDDDLTEGIIMYSKIFDKRRTFRVPRRHVNNFFHIDEERVKHILKETKPRFIVYSTKGYLPEALHFSSIGKREERDGIVFNFIYESGPFRIYEAIYKKDIVL